ncbi:restriction endonuclease subunit S [Photobacterium leiognathi]|uniref:restriction endonuclease subunit S n=1 Tax=Photobacterium leiognathi TaxID=553611 RepID=UPI002736C5F3|nr:restriction endonuclease subunit S [Photobacterium leiognathi]
MSKYQPYPEYKDSEIEWLDEIPTHWIEGKIKYVTTNLDYRRIPLSAEERGKRKGSFPYYGASGIIDSVDNFLFDEQTILIGEDGANLLSRSTPLAFIASGKYWVNNHAHILKPLDKIYTYWVNAFNNIDITPVVSGSAQPKLTAEALGNLSIVYPASENERKQIAAFLDHETAKIDTLIEKQQQLIELLKEKRQAVISHAVTKGLNPDAPMKDSGIEWLGEVPEHWDVCLFKHKCNEVTDGAHISPDLKDGAHYFVSIKDIKNGIINFDNALLTSSKSYDYLVKTGCMPFAGDILFSKDGTIGQTAITPNDIDFVVASSLIIIRPNRQQVVSEYLDFLLQSSLVQEQVESFIKGAALRRLSIQNLLKIFGVFPSLGEQKEIAEYIKNQLKKYSDLMIQANSQVKLLHERRTALISAAVTGKIDVRSWIAPTTSSDTNEAAQEVTA